MHEIALDKFQGLSSSDLTGIFQLRYQTFKTRLEWDVETGNGEERDEFDHADTVYIIAKSPEQTVDACWRLLPTTERYMLRDVFPELLHGTEAPNDPRIWELSRFAVAQGKTGAQASAFGPLPIALMAESVRFARRSGIDRYVTVTSVAVERLLKRQGINIHRIGPPIRIGVVLTVACVIELDGQTAEALGVDHAPDGLDGVSAFVMTGVA